MMWSFMVADHLRPAIVALVVLIVTAAVLQAQPPAGDRAKMALVVAGVLVFLMLAGSLGAPEWLRRLGLERPAGMLRGYLRIMPLEWMHFGVALAVNLLAKLVLPARAYHWVAIGAGALAASVIALGLALFFLSGGWASIFAGAASIAAGHVLYPHAYAAMIAALAPVGPQSLRRVFQPARSKTEAN